jgi:hypothetical protein
MHMHVSESGNKKFSESVDDSRATRDVKQRGRADGRDARISNNDSGVGLRRRSGDVNYRDVSNGKALWLRRGAGNQLKREKCEQETRQRSETWKIHSMIIACGGRHRFMT